MRVISYVLFEGCFATTAAGGASWWREYAREQEEGAEREEAARRCAPQAREQTKQKRRGAGGPPAKVDQAGLLNTYLTARARGSGGTAGEVAAQGAMKEERKEGWPRTTLCCCCASERGDEMQVGERRGAI